MYTVLFINILKNIFYLFLFFNLKWEIERGFSVFFILAFLGQQWLRKAIFSSYHSFVVEIFTVTLYCYILLLYYCFDFSFQSKKYLLKQYQTLYTY